MSWTIAHDRIEAGDGQETRRSWAAGRGMGGRMKPITHHRVSPEQAGTRLDKVLTALPGVGSREQARRALRTGKVWLDGKVADMAAGGQPAVANCAIEIRWNQPGTSVKRAAGREAMAQADISVVHEDAHLLVVNKPAGLLTDAATRQQTRTRDTLRKRVRAWVGSYDVWPAHRIDRDTSGVIAFAKTPEARQSLHDQWVARTPLRAYLVVVEGRVPNDTGHLAHWMRWDRRGRVQRITPPEADEAVLAECDYRVTQRFGPVATQLEVRLVSGRRNQIRLQWMRAGHALVGETQYRLPRTRPAVNFARQALHARRLGFEHPDGSGEVQFEAPLPDDLKKLLRTLRK